jgi:hypothetical protein
VQDVLFAARTDRLHQRDLLRLKQDQIVFSSPLDLYWSSPESGELWYKLGRFAPSLMSLVTCVQDVLLAARTDWVYQRDILRL